MIISTVVVIVVAVGLDLLLGEQPNTVHPVAWFGQLVAVFDREWSEQVRTQRWIGVGIAIVLPLVPALVAWGIVSVSISINSIVGTLVAAIVLSQVISLRSLLDLTTDVIDASESDTERAKTQIRGLVGRETETLTPAGIRSGAVESAAENLSDGLVATLLPFALLAPFSIPGAVGVAAWVKGVNTLDSMLGYPSKPHGTASAHLDDIVMFVPARVTALSLAVATFDPSVLNCARRWAGETASPNAGWPMATIACALDVRLEKHDTYVLNTTASLPTLDEGHRAVTLVGLAALISVAFAIGLAFAAPTLGSVTSTVITQLILAFELVLQVIGDILESLFEWITALFEWLTGSTVGYILATHTVDGLGPTCGVNG